MGKQAFATAAAAALAGGAGFETVRTFLPAAPVSSDRSEGHLSLRGAQRASPQSAQGAQSALIGLAAGAAGAAVAAQARRTTTRRRAAAAAPAEEVAPPPFDPALQLGATAPLGFFDPLGFCKVGDEETFRRMRSAELKHGRVAMMASVGAVIQATVQFPGFEKVPKGLGAVFAEPGIYGFVALFLVSGALELTIWKDDPRKGVESIGDFGNPLQFGTGAPLGESEDMKNRELNNGRAAMFAILGIVAAELATGKNALEQLA